MVWSVSQALCPTWSGLSHRPGAPHDLVCPTGLVLHMIWSVSQAWCATWSALSHGAGDPQDNKGPRYPQFRPLPPGGRLKNSTKAKPIGCEMASTLVKLHHIPLVHLQPGPPPCIYISFLKLTVLLGISCRACPCEGSSVCQ
ncbi:unnamed protein product [Arctogadus glacialis]